MATREEKDTVKEILRILREHPEVLSKPVEKNPPRRLFVRNDKYITKLEQDLKDSHDCINSLAKKTATLEDEARGKDEELNKLSSKLHIISDYLVSLQTSCDILMAAADEHYATIDSKNAIISGFMRSRITGAHSLINNHLISELISRKSFTKQSFMQTPRPNAISLSKIFMAPMLEFASDFLVRLKTLVSKLKKPTFEHALLYSEAIMVSNVIGDMASILREEHVFVKLSQGINSVTIKLKDRFNAIIEEKISKHKTSSCVKEIITYLYAIKKMHGDMQLLVNSSERYTSRMPVKCIFKVGFTRHVAEIIDSKGAITTKTKKLSEFINESLQPTSPVDEERIETYLYRDACGYSSRRFRIYGHGDVTCYDLDDGTSEAAHIAQKMEGYLRHQIEHQHRLTEAERSVAAARAEDEEECEDD